MNCPSCGAANPGDAHFCGECGTPLPTAAAPPPPADPEPVPPTVEAAPPPPPTPAPGSPFPPPPGSPFPPTVPVSTVPPVPPVPPGPPTEPPLPGGLGVPPPAAPPPERRSRRGLVIGLVALLAVAAAVGSFLVLGGDDGGGGGEQVVLEPIGATIEDDFAGNLDLDTPPASLDVALGNLPSLAGELAATLAGRSTEGSVPGLFGGTRDVAVCDVEAMIDFLTDEDNAAKAEAWADAQGIEVDDIEDFLSGLTPVRLRFDTRVTNHGFRDGEANPFQSILERGTAVLVDDEGVPRAKCNCGNPLLEPAEVGDVEDGDALDVDALAQNPDDAWDGFDPDDVVTVEPGDGLDELVLVDVDDGSLFARPIGTNGDADRDVEDLDALCEELGDSPTCGEEPPDDDTTTTTEADPDDTTTTTGEDATTTTTVVLGTGDVQVTLEWDSAADLDLSVTDPAGEVLDFANRGPNGSGGQLDVDSNVDCEANGSVENVFWPPGQAPAGDYSVTVTGFDVQECAQGAQSGDYRLTIRVAGQPDQVFNDSVGEDEVDTFPFSA